MKQASASLALLLLCAVGSSRVAASRPIRVDDPPPEPADCPLCGGDPMVHAVKTFAILGTGADLAARAMRW